MRDVRYSALCVCVCVPCVPSTNDVCVYVLCKKSEGVCKFVPHLWNFKYVLWHFVVHPLFLVARVRRIDFSMSSTS